MTKCKRLIKLTVRERYGVI